MSQTCEKCKEGEFSVGDGKRFADWDKLPLSFKSRGFSEIGVYEAPHNKGKDDPCFRYDDFYVKISIFNTGLGDYNIKFLLSEEKILLYIIRIRKLSEIALVVFFTFTVHNNVTFKGKTMTEPLKV